MKLQIKNVFDQHQYMKPFEVSSDLSYVGITSIA